MIPLPLLHQEVPLLLWAVNVNNGVAYQSIVFVAFLQFSASELQMFLSDDNLNVNSESQAFEALQKWTTHNRTEGLQNIKSLISQIRLPLLPKQYLTENVMTQEILKSGGKNLGNKMMQRYQCSFIYFLLHVI